MDGGPSITDFINRASLAELCNAIEDATGIPVRLYGANEGPLAPHNGSQTNAQELVEPIRIGTRTVGALAISDAETKTHTATRSLLGVVASLLGERCDSEQELRQRIDELDAHYRLGSLLVGAGSVKQTLETGLRSAIELLHTDAGAVRLLDEAEQSLSLQVSEGLSETYIRTTEILPAEDILDKSALKGESIAFDDIQASRWPVPSKIIEDEGIKSMLSTGLVFRGKPMGVIRLYSRTPRVFTLEERELLRSIGQQIATALASAKLIEQERAARASRRQMKVAAHVQRRMLPASIPSPKGFEIAAQYESSYEIGGDFYDVFELPSHNPDGPNDLAIVIGDVVGKGIPAALLMSNVRSTLRAFAHHEAGVSELLSAVNRSLCRDTLPEEFVTLFFGRIDLRTRRLTYSSAGHEPPLVVRPSVSSSEPSIIELCAGGIVGGVDPTAVYETGIFDLQPEDVLFACTDGLPEAMNFDFQTFSRQRVKTSLRDFLVAEPAVSASRIAMHMLWEMRRFAGLQRQSDDTTILTLRVGSTDDSSV